MLFLVKPSSPVNIFRRFPSSQSFFLLTFSSSANIGGAPAASSASDFPFLPVFDLSDRILNPRDGHPSSREIAAAVGDWFRLGTTAHSDLDRIYTALASSPDDASLDAALSRLNIRLSESLVLQTLRHRPVASAIGSPAAGSSGGTSLLLLRLRFFDWSGRKFPYRHTRAAYHAIFQLLGRADLVSVVLDWLRLFSSSSPDLRRHHFIQGGAAFSASSVSGHHPRFHDTLIVGYAVAGKPEIALQLLARMRFEGLDLDAFSYHVLLNSLVESSIFDFADSLHAQISARGHAGPVTACIQLKSLCRQERLEEAETYLRELAASSAIDRRVVAGRMVGTLAHALCRKGRFKDAGKIIDEFGSAKAYGVWVGNLVGAGRLDAALEFLESKKVSEDYIPETFHYSKLIFCLLRENRLEEVYNLLVEMIEEGIAPDYVTMNGALCFFCKAGMVDVAILLYNCRMELGINPSLQVFDHLVTALCRGGNVDDVCQVLEEAMQDGYFPGKKTFNILAELLCREGRLDKMRKLLDGALQREAKPLSVVFARYITALCKAGEMEEACLVPQMIGGKDAGLLGRYKSTYTNLIRAFIMLQRVDVLPRLIIEMQENGHMPSYILYRSLICCLCKMDMFDEVFDLLNKQLERKELDNKTCYNYFIDGAAHAKKPEIAREVYRRMEMAGWPQTIDSSILMVKSYLKSKRIGDALTFFYYLREKQEPSTRLYNAFIHGLCEAKFPDEALVFWKEMREKGMIPSLQCYEDLVLALSSAKHYDIVVKVLKDFSETGRPASSFLCNVLLLHTLKSERLLVAWHQSREDIKSGVGDDTRDSAKVMLGRLISVFACGIRMRENIDKLEEEIRNSFPMDVYSYNMLLRGFSMAGRMDYACDLFNRMPKMGFQPNLLSFDIMVHGFCKCGQRKEAEKWIEAMYRHGFELTSTTKKMYERTH